MATTLIGTLRPHAKGVHVQANAYNIMDVVTSADGSRAYMAVQDVPAGIGLDNAAYWCIYTDMTAVKTAMEAAAARADASASSANEAINNLTDYTSEYALRVRGEIAESAGNPVTIAPDEGSLIRPVTVFGPKQEGSGDPSPDNVRPIGGYDALGLTWCGKNLFGGSMLRDAFLNNVPNIQHDPAAGTIAYSAKNITGVKIFEHFKPETQYTVILHGLNQTSFKATNLQIRYTDGSVDAFAFASETEYSNAVLVTKPGRSVECLVGNWVSGTTTLKYNLCGIFEGVVSLEDFEPYNGDTYTAHPGQTVYGGKMDWNTGVLTLNLWKITFDGVTPGARVDRTDKGVIHYAYMDAASMPYPIKPKGICTGNKTTGSIYIVLGFGLPESLTGCVPGDDPLTVAAKYNAVMKAWYDAGDPLEFVYEMNNPITIQLTPHQILALKGNNTLYGDGDSIETLWVKPLETSIKERTEPLIERIAALEAAILNG